MQTKIWKWNRKTEQGRERKEERKKYKQQKLIRQWSRDIQSSSQFRHLLDKQFLVHEVIRTKVGTERNTYKDISKLVGNVTIQNLKSTFFKEPVTQKRNKRRRRWEGVGWGAIVFVVF